MTAHRVVSNHGELDGVGQKTHAQIDSHITDTTFVIVSGSTPDSGRKLAAGSGVSLVDEGPGGRIVIHASGSSAPVPATNVGQVLFSVDGLTFTARTPVTHPDHGWLMQDDGIFIVSG